MADSIATTVAEIRAKYGFTQEALARHLGVTFSTVNAWEAGRALPQPRHRARLQQLAQPSHTDSTELTVLISDPVARRLSATRRTLSDASQALGLPIVMHEEPDEVCALVKIGALRPDIIVFTMARPLIPIDHLLSRLSLLPATMGSSILLLQDSNAELDLGNLPQRVRAVATPLLLADAGAALRQAAAEKLQSQSLPVAM
jgi:putative transcriptional regulator